MIEVVRRGFRLIGVDPGIRDVVFAVGANCMELIVKCTDSRLAPGEKGSTVKQASSTIREAIGVKSLSVFIERC